MSKNKRRNFGAEFKAKIAIEAIKETQTLSELRATPNQIREWKQHFLEGASQIFSTDVN